MPTAAQNHRACRCSTLSSACEHLHRRLGSHWVCSDPVHFVGVSTGAQVVTRPGVSGERIVVVSKITNHNFDRGHLVAPIRASTRGTEVEWTMTGPLWDIGSGEAILGPFGWTHSFGVTLDWYLPLRPDSG